MLRFTPPAILTGNQTQVTAEVDCGCSEGEEREVVSKCVGETRKFSGKGNGGRDRRKAAQRKTQEAVG